VAQLGGFQSSLGSTLPQCGSDPHPPSGQLYLRQVLYAEHGDGILVVDDRPVHHFKLESLHEIQPLRSNAADLIEGSRELHPLPVGPQNEGLELQDMLEIPHAQDCRSQFALVRRVILLSGVAFPGSATNEQLNAALALVQHGSNLGLFGSRCLR
jgi:hypothetical protein